MTEGDQASQNTASTHTHTQMCTDAFNCQGTHLVLEEQQGRRNAPLAAYSHARSGPRNTPIGG